MATTSTALVVAEPKPPATAEDEVELPVDLTQIPMIPMSKSLLLITNFVANTTRFMNHFAHECEERITTVSTNLTRVEILLAILEAKLNSIPDLTVSEAAMAQANNGGVAASSNEPVLNIDSQDLPDAGGSSANIVPPPPPPPPPSAQEGMDESMMPPPPPPPPPMNGDPNSSALVVAPESGLGPEGDIPEPAEAPAAFLKLKDDPIYAKYFTMRRLGMPDQIIEHKLLMDGVDPGILSMDPEGPSPSGGAPIAAPSEPSGPLLPLPPPPISSSALPPPPPSIAAKSESNAPASGNIGMPFPPPTNLIASPTSSTSSRGGGPNSLFGDLPPPPPGPPAQPPLPPESEFDSSSDEEGEPTPGGGFLKLKDDPEYAKYFTMRKLGMPEGVIAHKLKMDGIELDILSMDPEGPSPNAGAVPAGAPQTLPPPPGPPLPPAGRPGLPPPPIPRYDDDDDFDSD